MNWELDQDACNPNQGEGPDRPTSASGRPTPLVHHRHSTSPSAPIRTSTASQDGPSCVPSRARYPAPRSHGCCVVNPVVNPPSMHRVDRYIAGVTATVCLTGCTGYLAGNVCARLLALGCIVHGTCRDPTKAKELQASLRSHASLRREAPHAPKCPLEKTSYALMFSSLSMTLVGVSCMNSLLNLPSPCTGTARGRRAPEALQGRPAHPRCLRRGPGRLWLPHPLRLPLCQRRAHQPGEPPPTTAVPLPLLSVS